MTPNVAPELVDVSQRRLQGLLDLTFGVLKYPLYEHGIFGDSLRDQQYTLWNTEPPHDAAAHCFLKTDTRSQQATENPSKVMTFSKKSYS